MTKKKRKGGSEARHGYGQGKPYPVELRLRAVRAVVDDGTEAVRVARALGIPPTTLNGWVRRYRDKGVDGLFRSRGRQ